MPGHDPTTGVVFLLLPLLSAVVYVTGALLLKRASELGVSTWRIAWVCNASAALVFAPLLALGGVLPDWSYAWQPAVVAVLFVVGQVMSFRALEIGDVSVATPVLGLKVILVGLFTLLILRERLTPAIWIAAALSSAALALLNVTSGEAHRRVGATILMTSLAAIAYALFDVLVQRWSPAWGPGRFLPVTMGIVAVLSLPMRARGAVLHRQSTQSARGWLLGGAACLAVQSIMFVLTIALFGHAAMANVLYSSRGLWSVIAVWAVGHWFRSREQHLGRRVLGLRLCGAVLLLGAIVLVMVDRSRPERREPRSEAPAPAFGTTGAPLGASGTAR